MNVNTSLAALSNHLLTATVLLYGFAMLLYAADAAFGAKPDVPVKKRARSKDYTRVHATSSLMDIPVQTAPEPVSAPEPVKAEPVKAEPMTAPLLIGSPAVVHSAVVHTAPMPAAGLMMRAALILTGLGWSTHLGSIVTRGMAAHRVPWGNMFEFSSALALVAVTSFGVLVLRRPEARAVGIFVMVPVLLTLGLAATVLYTDAGPLVPALKSYWLKIHVVAVISASGIFMVGGVTSVMYLVRERYERVGARPGRGGIVKNLPEAATLDRLQYRIIVFGLPIWTFGVMAGAIWAESAWGRYWGWDPKETWSFITWVIYAGYLHARATAGWKGRKAAWIALAGFSALTIDYYLINLVVTGLHSYAGVGG